MKRSRLIMSVFLMLAGFVLHSTAQAQDHPKYNSTRNYFLDNFKCSLDMGASMPIVSSHKDASWRSALQAGLSFGYYILKYNHTQRGVLRNSIIDYNHVNIHTGKGLISVEVGLRYPERRFMEYSDSMQTEKQLIAVPITIQWATPDYFTGGSYTTFFLGYNIKKVLASHIKPRQNNKQLTLTPTIAPSLFHSVIIGVAGYSLLDCI